jgi:hypothetical protein
MSALSGRDITRIRVKMMSAKFIAFVVFSLIAGASSDEARQGGPQVYFRRAFTFLF